MPQAASPPHTPPPAPLAIAEVPVDPAWINTSGHMTAGQYVVVFEQSFHQFMATLGGATDKAAPFLLEMHTCYFAEAASGDTLCTFVQVLGVSANRLQLLLSMRRSAGDTLIASTELDVLNIALATRQPAPWSAERHARLNDLATAHQAIPVPKQVGRGIRRLTTGS